MRSFLSLAVAALALSIFSAPAQADEPISFTKQIAPIFVKHCAACHGQSDPKGGYQLHTFESLMKPGESGDAPVKAGDVKASYLYSLLVEGDKDAWMPKEADKLPEAQLAVVRKWIEEGAKFDSPDPKATLASIAPKPPHPMPPEIYPVAWPVTALAFRPDGKELAVGGYHEITIWNPDDGALLRRIKNVAERSYGLAYNNDGSLLAVACGTPGIMGEIKLFNPNDGALVKDLGTMSDTAFGVAFSPDGKKLAGCAADRSIRIYDVESGKQESLIEDHADWVMAVAWSPDGTKLASASRDKTSKVFDVKTGDSQATYPGHNEAVFGVAFNADGKQVLTAGANRQVHAWNPADGKKVGEIGGYGEKVYKVIFVAGKIFSCSGDKTAREHDGGNRNQIRQFAGHTDWVYTVAYNDAVKKVATGTYDGEVRIFNEVDGKELLKFRPAPGLKPVEPPPAAPAK